jgi:hypothetical protein
VSELAADGIPVAVTCRVLNIARQPYYRWRANPVTDAERDEAYRADALFDAHRGDPEFGYRFLAQEAGAAGEPMAERTAWRICTDNRWWSVFGKKRSKNGKPGPPVHDDLVARDFTAETPNQLWLSDITEHWTAEGKLYLCAVKDVFKILVDSILAMNQEPRVYELRTYQVADGQFDALMRRFRDHAVRLFVKHGIGVEKFWRPMDSDGNPLDQVVYLLSFDSRAQAQVAWAAFVADPEWRGVRRDSEADGPLVEGLTSVYMADLAELV